MPANVTFTQSPHIIELNGDATGYSANHNKLPKNSLSIMKYVEYFQIHCAS